VVGKKTGKGWLRGSLRVGTLRKGNGRMSDSCSKLLAGQRHQPVQGAGEWGRNREKTCKKDPGKKTLGGRWFTGLDLRLLRKRLS